MDKTKILYITYNGVGESIFQSQCLPYLRGLSGKGHEIVLLSYERSAREISKNAEMLKGLNIKWVRLKYHKKPRLIATSFDFLLGMMAVFFATLFCRINVIHARATHGAIIGAPVAILLRRKFVFDTRGLDSEEYVDGGLIAKDFILHKLVFGLERFLFRISDAVILLSDNAKKLLKDKGLDRHINSGNTYVIPCAVDLNLFRPGKKNGAKVSDDFKLIYVGSIGTWYMLDEMLGFFSMIKGRLAGSEFLMFTQSDKFEIIKKAKELNISENTKADYIAHELVPQKMSECDAGICFIKNVSSKRASSPTKMGEYLACGLPVIINSGVGDMENIVKENKVGVVIDKFEPAIYGKAIDDLLRLLKDDSLSARCRVTAERFFSLNDAVEKYDIIYKKLTEGIKR